MIGKNPTVKTLRLINAIYRLRAQGLTLVKIAEITGIHFSSTSLYLKAIREHPEYIQEGGETK